VHELSITQSIVDTIADKTEDAKVIGILLEIGKFSGVVPDSVRFCFDLVTDGTRLQGARLDITEPPGRVHCRACQTDQELTDTIPLCSCGSADVEIIDGRQLRIKSVEVA
jgi:hydrogenase nickel incorporation protein HypA/HybF